MDSGALRRKCCHMDTNTTLPTPSITVDHILDRYQTEYVPHELAPRTQKDYARHIATLRRLWGSRVAADLKPKDFADFLHAEGRRKGRIQRVRILAVLSGAFTEAVSSWYLLERNTLRDVKRPKNPPRDRLVTNEEFQAVRAIAPLRVKLMMDLAVRTGQRQGDLLDLKWSQIKGMDVYFQQSKTGKRIVIEITPDLESVLDRCWNLPNRGEYVITRQIGGRFTSEGFRAAWQRTMNKYVHRGGTRHTFHDLRALAATRCATPEEAMRLLGHSNISMTLSVYRRAPERCRPVQLSVSGALQ